MTDVKSDAALLDDFAKAALTGLLANPDCDFGSRSELAKWCYWMANDMLTEKRKQDGRT